MFGGLISPMLGLNLVRTELEAQLKRPVKNYTMVCNVLNNTVAFILFGKEVPFDKPSLINDMVKSFVSEKLDKGSKIDVIKILVGETTGSAECYYTIDEEKQVKTITF